MASPKIRGITIQLGADTSGIDKALQKVNKELGSTTGQLKDVERLLKLDPTNTELLAQKQKLLADQVGKTEEKMKTLIQAQDEFVENGGDKASKEYMALEREIIACEQNLSKAYEAQAEFEASINSSVQKYQALADKAGAVADKTKYLSATAAGALSAITGLAIRSAAAADDLNTMSKQTGIATDTLQKMKLSADLLDVSVSDVTGAVRKLKANLDGQEATWTAIGVSVKDASGEYRDIEEIFWDTVSALGQIENEAQRDEYAMALFGKSADQLAGYLDDGGAAARELFDSLEDSILDQETLDSMNDVNDAIDRMRMQFSAMIAQNGAAALEAIAPVLEDLSGALSKVFEIIAGLSPAQMELILGVLALTAAISPVAKTISAVAGAMAAFEKASLLANMAIGAEGTAGAVTGLGTKILGFISGPMGMLIAAIVGLVLLIATKGDEIQSILQKVDDFLQNVFTFDFTEIFGPILGTAINNFVDGFQFAWNNVTTILNGVIDFIQAVFSGNWSAAWDAIKGIFTGVFQNVYDFAVSKLQGVLNFINKIIGVAKEAIEKINEMTNASNDSKGNRKSGGGQKNTPWDAIVNPGMPMLANGGTISSGSAIVGEAGAELLTVANGRATVTPLNVTMNNTFGNYNNAAGKAVARDLVRQINTELGRLY